MCNLYPSPFFCTASENISLIPPKVILFHCLTLSGQFTVIYLYLKYRFDWNEVMYGIFLFYGCMGMIVGKFFNLILNYLLK